MRLSKDTYVDAAENVIKSLRVEKRDGTYEIKMTTSKIRNILSMVTELYNDVIHTPGEELDDDIVQRIQYLRLRIAYEAGREETVREFVKKTKILNYVKQIGNKKANFLLFVNYMEALVAYHRYYRGKDQ